MASSAGGWDLVVLGFAFIHTQFPVFRDEPLFADEKPSVVEYDDVRVASGTTVNHERPP
jgi:hypothetical protein